MCDIENYVLINAPRLDQRSGGSALYVHNSVSYRIREDLKLTINSDGNNNHSESVFIEILNSVNKNIIIGNVYRVHYFLLTWKIVSLKYLMKISSVIFLEILI